MSIAHPPSSDPAPARLWLLVDIVTNTARMPYKSTSVNSDNYDKIIRDLDGSVGRPQSDHTIVNEMASYFAVMPTLLKVRDRELAVDAVWVLLQITTSTVPSPSTYSLFNFPAFASFNWAELKGVPWESYDEYLHLNDFPVTVAFTALVSHIVAGAFAPSPSKLHLEPLSAFVAQKAANILTMLASPEQIPHAPPVISVHVSSARLPCWRLSVPDAIRSLKKFNDWPILQLKPADLRVKDVVYVEAYVLRFPLSSTPHDMGPPEWDRFDCSYEVKNIVLLSTGKVCEA